MAGTGTGTKATSGDFITITDLKSEMEITGSGNDTLLTSMVSMVQSMWDNLTEKTWGQTTHEERYNGTGDILVLRNYPVTSIDYISTGQDEAIKIGNTGTHSTATVAVTSTGLVLALDGSPDSTVLFVTYATMTTVVAAVNALGSGWSASVQGSYGDWKSTELLIRYSSSCFASVYLYVPGNYLANFTFDTDSGKIVSSCLPEGHQNIYVKYTAGYTDSTVPTWLKQTLIRQASHWYRQAKDQKWDMSSKSEPAGAGTVAYTRLQNNLLPDFWAFVQMNRRRGV